MPTYQYVCTDCDAPLEAVQSFTDDALTVCPTCGGRLRKVFSAVGVVFKGSGFYRTDSRTSSSSDGETKKAKEPAATSSGSGASDGATGSTKQSGATSASGPSTSGGSGTSGSSSAA